MRHYLSNKWGQVRFYVNLDTAYILGGLIDRSIIKYASLMRSK